MFRATMVFLLVVASATAGVITLEDVSVPAGSYVNNVSFTSGGATFNNDYNAGWGSWGGFAASSVVDTTTAGWMNQYASFAGGGDASSQYAVGYLDTFTPTIPRITLPAGMRADSARITNTTYTALSMLLGTDPPAKKFGGVTGNDADWFLLTITGYAGASVTGTVEFYLADYRFANNALDYIVDDWMTVNLSGLGNATAMEFAMTSSDNGGFGMNTPSYFALDNLQITPVPEPGSLALLGLAVVLTSRKRKRRKVLLVSS